MGADLLILHEKESKIKIAKDNVRLDFGGIGKGYIGDQVGKNLEEQGINSYLIDMGGDLICGNAPPDQDGWLVRIPWLDHLIQIANGAIATSGPDYQFFVHKGVQYAHIIDPKTGWGVKDIFSTTVIAPEGWIADALASACAIMLPEKSLSVLENYNAVGVLGIRGELYASDKFDAYIVKK